MAFVIITPPVIWGLDPDGSLALSQRCRERNQFSHGSPRLMAFTAWMLSQQNMMGNTVASCHKPDKHFPQDNFLLGKSNKQHQIHFYCCFLIKVFSHLDEQKVSSPKISHILWSKRNDCLVQLRSYAASYHLPWNIMDPVETHFQRFWSEKDQFTHKSVLIFHQNYLSSDQGSKASPQIDSSQPNIWRFHHTLFYLNEFMMFWLLWSQCQWLGHANSSSTRR